MFRRFAIFVVILSSCAAADDDTASTAVAHPKAKICQQCASDVDCAEGLACDHLTFACKSPAMFVAQYGSPPTKLKQCSADCIPPCGTLVHCSVAETGLCIPDDVTCTNGDCRY